MQNIKSVLQECYGNKEAVTPELVDYILKPGLEVRPPPYRHFPHCLLHSFTGSSPAHGLYAYMPGAVQPGAVEVFLDFISYSGGPLPEELLPQMSRPVSILWGEADPWEPIELGRAYADYDCVEEFIPLPGASYLLC